jgi:phosphoglycolate phosphatase
MHLFFDLDGTLTDSSPGIVRCINHALVELGLDEVDYGQLSNMIGLPLTAIFETMLGSSDTVLIDRAVVAYRTRFNDVGLFENALFPGIAEALAALRDSGHALQIVTAKPAVSARRVVDHFEIARLFDDVHGPALGDRSCDKAVLVAAALGIAGDDKRHAVMIGDRAEDVLAGRANQIQAVGVGWGYGSRHELDAAGPAYVAEDVAALVQWIRGASEQRTPPLPIPMLAQGFKGRGK